MKGIQNQTATSDRANCKPEQKHAAAGNKCEYVTGDAGTLLDARALSLAFIHSSSARSAKSGVGIDSTTTFSGFVQGGYVQVVTTGSYVPVTGTYRGFPGLGYHYASWNESGGDGTNVWVGDNASDGNRTGLSILILG